MLCYQSPSFFTPSPPTSTIVALSLALSPPISSHGCVAFLAVPEVFSVLLVTDHILLLFFQQFARDVTPRTDLALSLTTASKTMFLCLFLLTLQPCAQVATSYLVH